MIGSGFTIVTKKYTFLNHRFKNAAIEQVEFTFGEGSIANRFIESRNTQ
jgi:hypothetical protein